VLGIDLRLQHPLVQSLRADPDLRSDRLSRGIPRPILTQMIENQLPDRLGAVRQPLRQEASWFGFSVNRCTSRNLLPADTAQVRCVAFTGACFRPFSPG
jgi:hypothetical protein